jgi:hypothetical protein
VAGSANTQYRYQFTGAGSVTAIGFGQRIEAANAYSLAGQIATLSVDLSNSLLTTVTWTAYYANTADTFGTLASPTRTQIATGTFTVSSTLTRYTTNISVPSAATTGIEIVFTVGAQTSGTWVIGNVQLEAGSTATPFEQRPIGMELALCQRYYYRFVPTNGTHVFIDTIVGTGTNPMANVFYPVTMRTFPGSSSIIGSPVLNGCTGLAISVPNPYNAVLNVTSNTGTSGRLYVLFNSTSGFDVSAEL